jgi:holo-[acyl-carrier protein] synthase
MILGIGVDLVEVARLGRALDRFGEKLLSRLFHGSEAAHCGNRRDRAECLAGIFAAKEAFLKALGTGLAQGVKWLDMEVIWNKDNSPHLRVGGRAREIMTGLGAGDSLVSISHDGGFALAMVLLQSRQERGPAHGKSPEARSPGLFTTGG